MEIPKTLLFAIYRLDKTPPYTYGKGKQARTIAGDAPRKGNRWLSPREIIRSQFGHDFFDQYNEWLKKVRSENSN
jgi:hypothetical protein